MFRVLSLVRVHPIAVLGWESFVSDRKIPERNGNSIHRDERISGKILHFPGNSFRIPSKGPKANDLDSRPAINPLRGRMELGRSGAKTRRQWVGEIFLSFALGMFRFFETPKNPCRSKKT